MISVKRSEIVRYLGYHGASADTFMQVEIDAVTAQLQETVTPRYCLKRFPLLFQDNHDLEIADMHIHSSNLAKNLTGCKAVYLFAATLGPQVDRLIRRSSVTQMAKTMLYQSASAAMIEAYVDDINRNLIQEAKKRSEFLRPRFSPGYGDFPLTHQKDFERLLEMQKNIGISLTESLLMVPSKSITAVIGISDTDTNCILQGCEVCTKKDCTFRRNTQTEKED